MAYVQIMDIENDGLSSDLRVRKHGLQKNNLKNQRPTFVRKEVFNTREGRRKVWNEDSLTELSANSLL